MFVELRSSGSGGAGALEEPPTDHDEDLPVDVGLDVDTAAAFRVVRATEAGDIHHAALVDVHHTGCEGREREVTAQAGSGWPGLRASSISCTWASWCLPAPSP